MTKLILKAMGARVNAVDEEGHVTLFCYHEDEQITINAGTVEASKRWGARIGDYVTLQVVAEKYEPVPLTHPCAHLETTYRDEEGRCECFRCGARLRQGDGGEKGNGT